MEVIRIIHRYPHRAQKLISWTKLGFAFVHATIKNTHLVGQIALGVKDSIGGVELCRCYGEVVVGVDEVEPGPNLALGQMTAGKEHKHSIINSLLFCTSKLYIARVDSWATAVDHW